MTARKSRIQLSRLLACPPSLACHKASDPLAPPHGHILAKPMDLAKIIASRDGHGL